MPLVHDEGIILQQHPYSESSLILTWFTKEHGIIRTMAKGALRPKQPLYGKMDLFYSGNLSFQYKEISNLHTLIEVSAFPEYAKLKFSFLHFTAASYFFEIIRNVVEPQTPITEIYELYEKFLQELSQNESINWKWIESHERLLALKLGVDDGSQSLKQIREHTHYPLPKSYHLLESQFSSLT
jgi:DNA repair protein RecO (recombination protein O)